ncbi:MAG: hypothetical protein QM730_21465 [Anaerolineales bacterium]
MKRILFITFVLALLLTACGGTSSASNTSGSDVYTSSVISTDYENALPVRNQLAIGTMKLDGTAQAVTAEQAKQLVPLYQALRGTTTSGGGSQEEISALLGQIEIHNDLRSAQSDRRHEADIHRYANLGG